MNTSMMDWLKDNGEDPLGGMPVESALGLLSMGLIKHRRPVDELIEHLQHGGADAWFEQALATTLPGIDVRENLLHGQASLARMMEYKKTAKTLIAQARDQDDMLCALAVYCMSVAATLCHHGRLVSSQPRSEWDELLSELGEVVPERWRDLLAKAIAVPPKSDVS